MILNHSRLSMLEKPNHQSIERKNLLLDYCIFEPCIHLTVFRCCLIQEKDPFWEPASSTPVLIGAVHVFLQSLAYMVELEENLVITDYKGKEQGHLKVEIHPTDSKGKILEDSFVEKPEDIVSLFFLNIISICILYIDIILFRVHQHMTSVISKQRTSGNVHCFDFNLLYTN